MSNFTFFHNVFSATCIFRSFNSHISVVVCSFFEFGTISKWCKWECVKKTSLGNSAVGGQNACGWPFVPTAQFLSDIVVFESHIINSSVFLRAMLIKISLKLQHAQSGPVFTNHSREHSLSYCGVARTAALYFGFEKTLWRQIFDGYRPCSSQNQFVPGLFV